MFNPNVIAQNILQKAQVANSIALLGRLMVAYIFVSAGWMKLNFYADTAQFMQSMGVPAALLPLTILLELGGGLALILGLQTRLLALALAGFSILTALMMHSGTNPQDGIQFMKNFAMAGGLLFVALHGAGHFSLDHLLERAASR